MIERVNVFLQGAFAQHGARRIARHDVQYRKNDEGHADHNGNHQQDSFDNIPNQRCSSFVVQDETGPPEP